MLNEILYSSHLTWKWGQGGKMIDDAIADNKLYYESQFNSNLFSYKIRHKDNNTIVHNRT